MTTLVFATDDMREIVRQVGIDRLMDELIDGLTTTLRNFNADRIRIPVRDGFEYTDPVPGLIEWMPALETGHGTTIKIVGYHPRNPDVRRLPTILSTALTFDTSTGHLTSIIDGTFPTALRTGAASAVASRILTHPDASVLGLVGCGAQAMGQLHGLARVFTLEQVFVYDVDSDTSRSFAERARSLGMDGLAITVAPLETVVRSSHILCTATSVEVGAGPVIPDIRVHPSLHVNAIGSDFPGKRELPDALLRRSFICPDFKPQAVKEGECQFLEADQIGPDLTELVKHERRYTQYRDGLTVFDSTGWALEDHVAVAILTAHGRRLGVGSEVELESAPPDPKNPYGLFDESARVTAGRAFGIVR